MPLRSLHPLLLVVPLLLAACGDDASNAPAPAAETAAPLAATAVAPAVAAPEPAAAVANPPPVADTPEPVAAAEPAAPTPTPTPPPSAEPVVAPAPGAAEPAETPAPAPALVTPPAAQPQVPIAPPEPAAPAALGPAAPVVPAAAAAPATATVEPAPDPALRSRIAAADTTAGAALAEACAICHTTAEGDRARIGPNLFDVVGRPVAAAPGFAYSAALEALGAAGAVWSFERLEAFLADPVTAVPGTRMTFPGIADPIERAAVIAWFRSLSATPVPLAAGVRPEGRVGDPVTFSVEQAREGEAIYENRAPGLNCIACHGDNLRGVVDVRQLGENEGDGPPLTRANFELHFFGKALSDLYAYLRDRKPRNDPGTLPEETIVPLIAYILEANGFAPGAPLPTDPTALAAMGFWQ